MSAAGVGGHPAGAQAGGDWTDEQCVAFMAVALRHVEYRRSDTAPDCNDIRLGARMAITGSLAPLPVNNIAASEARVAELEGLLAEARQYVAVASQGESGYGFARPANPHDFSPDVECCTVEEMAAHKAACEAYDRGEYTPEKGDGWVTPNLHILKAPWGVGMYTFRDDRAVACLDRINAALAGPAS